MIWRATGILRAGRIVADGKQQRRHQQNANLFGADVTLITSTPPRISISSSRAEAIYWLRRYRSHTNPTRLGRVVLAQQQLNRDWYAGCRSTDGKMR